MIGLGNLDPRISLRIRILHSWFTAEATFNLNSCIHPASLVLPVQCIFSTAARGAPLGHKAVPYLMLEGAVRCLMHRTAQCTSRMWKSKEVFLEERTVIMNMPLA